MPDLLHGNAEPAEALTHYLLSASKLNARTLAAPTDQQRVAYTMAAFRCMACHMSDGVGDKLRPEWLAKVLGDGVGVRPYINTRMPKFGAQDVENLADLLVTLGRHATPLAALADTSEAQRDAGGRLVGTDGLNTTCLQRCVESLRRKDSSPGDQLLRYLSPRAGNTSIRAAVASDPLSKARTGKLRLLRRNLGPWHAPFSLSCDHPNM
ncbi:MAG: hypothetical protein JWM59_3554 [Verrucomicrobiales bacterium]|nr:hypothetical protein [Verrucomicrobiales bacterium]